MSLSIDLAMLAQDSAIYFANPEDATIAINAINNEAYGAQNVLLGDGVQYLAVFKRCRTPKTHAALADRIQKLCRLISEPSYAEVRDRLVVGRSVTRNSTDWLLYPFADGPSAYVDIRSHVGDSRLVKLFNRALALAAKIEVATTESKSVSAVVSAANRALKQFRLDERVPESLSKSQIKVGLAHLDFVPDNVLLGESGDWLIDFEYWDEAPVLWNLLDIMSTFGSLAGLGRISRRHPSDFLRIFEPPRCSTISQLWRSSCQFIRQMGLAELSQPEVISLMHAWFAAKVVAQPRVYGDRYGFSADWLRCWNLGRDGPIESLARRWPRS